MEKVPDMRRWQDRQLWAALHNSADRWQNRRKMAWLALVAGLIFPVMLLATESSQLGAVATPFYIFVGTVVGAYIGFATVDDHWQKGNSGPPAPNEGPDPHN